MRIPAPPSGEQLEIVFGDQRAVVTEVGAALRLYEAGGRAVLDGFAADEMSPAYHGAVLAPWPNRVAGGRYRTPDGRTEQLALNEPDRFNALHGLVAYRPWRVAERAPESVTLECRLHPSPGYPFDLLLSAQYLLAAEGLRCTITALNAGDGAAPYGLGCHPYLACPGGYVGDARLRLPAHGVLETDARMIPTGVVQDVAGTALDFTTERAVGDVALDHCFTQLDADAGGVVRAMVSDGESWRTVLWMQAPFRWVMVFSSAPLDPPRRNRALAIEPMTCPPNALQTGVDLVVLQPGEACAATWGITAERL